MTASTGSKSWADMDDDDDDEDEEGKTSSTDDSDSNSDVDSEEHVSSFVEEEQPRCNATTNGNYIYLFIF